MKEMATTEDWDQCLAESDKAPVFLFKHSTRCPISSAAHRVMTDYLEDGRENQPPVRMVKVVESRPLSLQIADRLQVEHKSPQLILIRNQKAVWSTSHYDITPDHIRAALATIGSG